MYKHIPSRFHTLSWILYPGILLLGFHNILLISGMYSRYQNLDSIMHFLGGVAAAVGIWILLHALEQRDYLSLHHWLVRLLGVTIAVIAITAVWEIAEFACDILLDSNINGSVWDSMKDMVLGSAGGALCTVILTLRNKV